MSRFRKPYTIIRRAPGQYVHGIWQEGAAQEIVIEASVQPLNEQEVQTLPEGKRSGKAFKLFTGTELYEADQETESQDGRSADHIVIGGKAYEILRVLPYQAGLINHYKCYAVEVPE